jgi:hypothetical protein
MDRGQTKRDWTWLPVQMPGVQALISERRQQAGRAHVALCWQRGVVEGRPGWFYAAEGALAVGTPWPAIWELVTGIGQQGILRGKALVAMPEPADVAALEASQQEGAGHGG